MRFTPALLFLLLALPLGAAEARFVRVWPEYRDAGSFDRIAEYFGGREDQAPGAPLRTRPKSRDGYYFSTRIKLAEAVSGGVLALEVILPGSEKSVTHFFAVDLPRGKPRILAGITGQDWPGPGVRPVAWRVRLLATDGRELARETSFLWELPGSP